MSKKFLVDILAKAGLVVEGTTDLQGTATAITQSNSDNSTKLATTAFVKNQGYAADNLMVHLAGAETITGVKSFSPTVTASAGLGRSMFVDGTITAAANNNTLVGLDIAPVFDASTFTGVNSYAVRISGTYANTYPSYIKLVNNGVGAQTGAAIEFPFGQRIVASSLSPLVGGVGFTFFDKVSNTDGVGLNSSLLQFSSSTPSIKGSGNNGTLTIAQENGTSSFILLKSGGSIGFQTYISAAYTDVVRIFRLTGNVLLQNGGTFTDAGYRLDVNGTARLQGETRLTTLAGTGDRMVVANSSGVLSTQAIPSVSGFVPYTGATNYVDLGSNSFYAGGITVANGGAGSIYTDGWLRAGKGIFLTDTISGGQWSAGTTNIVARTGGLLITRNSGGGILVFDPSATYTYNFPAANGTIAFTSDLPSLSSLSGVPTSRTITINGTAYDLSADRSWTISSNINARTETEFTTNGSTSTYSATYTVGQVDVFYNGSKLSATEFTATNGTSITLGFTPPSGQLVEVVAWETGGGVANGRTLTINGTTYDLSANRSWTVTDSSKLSLSGGTLTGALSGTSATFSGNVQGANFLIPAGGKLQYSSSVYMTPEDNIQGARVKTSGGFVVESASTTFNFRNASSEIMDLKVATESSNPSKSKISLMWYGNETASIKFKRGGDATGGSLEFWTQAETQSLAQRMTITSDGNVGIGTSSPTNKLEVVGNVRISIGSGFDSYYGYGGNLDNYYSTGDSGTHIWRTGNTERMRITSGGNVLIGTTTDISSNYKVQLTGAGGVLAKGTNSGDASFLSINQGSGFHFYGLTTTGVFYVSNNGDVRNANNSYGAISDISLKENITDATPKLADLLKVKVRNYNLIADENKEKQIGVIAQELEEIFPNMISEDKQMGTDETIKTVKYSVFVPMLIKAIQEQQAQIEELKARLN